MSERAYASLLTEAISRDPKETGGVFLGQYEGNGKWYIVEATDPGLNTVHSVSYHEMDSKYCNHVYCTTSRLYKKDLFLVGLWHRHPGSLDSFSSIDNTTNMKYAEAVGNGTLSFLLNFDPKERLTCYYLDWTGDRQYHQVPLLIGDQYFEGTDYLEYASTEAIWQNRERLQRELVEIGGARYE